MAKWTPALAPNLDPRPLSTTVLGIAIGGEENPVPGGDGSWSGLRRTTMPTVGLRSTSRLPTRSRAVSLSSQNSFSCEATSDWDMDPRYILFRTFFPSFFRSLSPLISPSFYTA